MPKPHKTRRWQMVVVANDFHVPFHDEGALALSRRFLRSERPDWLILNGDFIRLRPAALRAARSRGAVSGIGAARRERRRASAA